MLVKGTGGAEVAAVGQSLDDRDETLGNLVASFALGGPIAVVIASLIGYTLAAAGLRPVEAMRRRAQQVSLSHEHAPLPLPAARDEIRRLGETLNEMLDRLGRSFERERRFVADASHELRTPVAVIKTELEGALRAGGHDPEVREALVAVDRGMRSPRATGRRPADRRSHERGRPAGVARARRGPRAARARPASLRRPRGGARADDHGRGRRRAARVRRRAPPATRRSATSSTTRCATARARSCCARALGVRGSSSTSPITARASRRTSPSVPSSASPAGTSRAHATAPASASRSCARSPRPTAAGPSSCRASGRPSASRLAGQPPQGHLSLAT